ncbi:DUF4062 domain-containing protein [Enterobacter sichuanensis]|uniref:DUF4062 domain-containing protein n=1 Tax=Enterobacter sichuanensis TaxID=2071710 RepID=UPI000B499E3C
MANNVRYQIFVSSTYTDLFPARRKVTEHILSMNHIPAGMEMFSASGRQQWNTIKKAIDNSDYYVLIVGERYGSISEEDGVSYTEKEFDYARQKNIPTLCFLPGNSFTTTRENRESEPLKIKMLEDFKKKVLDNQLCAFWEREDELIQKISTALYKIFTEEPGVGWIRGDASDPEVLTKLVKVMEENNNLREKVRLLEAEKLTNKPELSFIINGHDNALGALNIVLPELDSEVFSYDSVRPLTHNDIPSELRRYVNEADLAVYNEQLPEDSEVETYLDSMQFYLFAKNNLPVFTISNTSVTKANNVSIRIHLPDGLIALSTSDMDDYEVPALGLPKNPIDEAAKKRNAAFQTRDFGFFPLIGNNSRSINIPDFSKRDLYIEGKDYIEGGLRYVRQNTIDEMSADIHLLPLKRGTFTVKVSILCDEFPDWETTDILISVK